jgi:uncharacterized protein (TIGR00251 family)
VIEITDHAEGSVLAVRVQPGARKSGVKGEQAGALKLAVTAPPEDGRANEAVVELLAEVLGVKRKQLELVIGATSRNKKILVRGLPSVGLRERLTQILDTESKNAHKQ